MPLLFDIIKCGVPDCSICLPPRLPPSDFKKLSHLPDPTPGMDNHYQPFSHVFKTETTEKHRPSLSKPKPRSKEKSLPFYPSVQHVKNASIMLLCDECEKKEVDSV